VAKRTFGVSIPLVVYVDVDDTLVRTAGTTVIPVGGVAGHIQALAAEGAVLYCWSSGGAEYARSVAERLGLAECFVGFLPKPHVLLDDQAVSSWRRLVQIHPAECVGWTAEAYRRLIDGERPA
jgi:hypothetical protein